MININPIGIVIFIVGVIVAYFVLRQIFRRLLKK